MVVRKMIKITVLIPHKTIFWSLLFNSLVPCTFRTTIIEQRPLRTVYMTPYGSQTLLSTADAILWCTKVMFRIDDFHFLFHKKKYNPHALTVPPFLHLTSWTPTKYNLYLASSMTAAVCEPALNNCRFTFVYSEVTIIKLYIRSKKGKLLNHISLRVKPEGNLILRRLWKTEILPTSTIENVFDHTFLVYVLMLKHVTVMKSLVVWDLMVTGWMGVNGWCSEGTWDFEMLDGCDWLMFWRHMSVTSQRIWIFNISAVTHSSLTCHCHVTKARITC